MNHHIDKIKAAAEPLRKQILQHKLYSIINDIDDLKVFMQYHVYAVWDFMSLLKALQNNLTCTTVPWYPKGTAENRYLINEIVVGEESDTDLFGNRKSHFEMYLSAMDQCGADTTSIGTFIHVLHQKENFTQAYKNAGTPLPVQEFVNFTFETIYSDKDYLQAAVFTFGREDLIPDMFISIINDLDKKFKDSISLFKYYLERHIEVDGGHHSHLALQMLKDLCGNNEQFWKEAELVIIESLKKRIALWDGVYNHLMTVKYATLTE